MSEYTGEHVATGTILGFFFGFMVTLILLFEACGVMDRFEVMDICMDLLYAQPDTVLVLRQHPKCLTMIGEPTP
ncbi:MAG: hypothetical protein KAJ55_00145 [Anaerolineales bacterium]|nr:hypothetical protein [Anaerolineales bacterium]